jgi:proteasome accessory factor A
MSDPFVFGVEWELAVGCTDPRAALGRERAYMLLRQAVCDRAPWLSDGASGVFTPAFRLYLDTGMHPEVASAEVSSPIEMLELKQAIFAALADAAGRVREQIPGFVLAANNHDYLDATAFWGCHESYAMRCHPSALAGGMLPFLATRHLLAGNGRIDRHGRVLFSSRAQAMMLATGGATTSDRALYSTARDEPLMTHGPFKHRLHLICGDAVRSQLSEYLKLATTALVLRWLEEDPNGANDLNAQSPVRLLRAANVFWRPDRGLHVHPRALSIQRAYCDRVAGFVARRSSLPAWCSEAVARWANTLDLLQADPLALIDRLDPFIKLAFWDASLQALGKKWTDLAVSKPLYQQLALLDVAYHTLDDSGPFGQLDGSGALRHRVLDSTALGHEVAKRLGTRAAARATLIEKLTGQRDTYCGWAAVWSYSPVGYYDLCDPTLREPPPFRDRKDRRLPPPGAVLVPDGFRTLLDDDLEFDPE